MRVVTSLLVVAEAVSDAVRLVDVPVVPVASVVLALPLKPVWLDVLREASVEAVLPVVLVEPDRPALPESDAEPVELVSVLRLVLLALGLVEAVELVLALGVSLVLAVLVDRSVELALVLGEVELVLGDDEELESVESVVLALPKLVEELSDGEREVLLELLGDVLAVVEPLAVESVLDVLAVEGDVLAVLESEPEAEPAAEPVAP